MRALSTAQAHFKIFWGREEALVLGGNLAIHLLVQAFALLLMPFAYFSELSLHDGHVYYTISQNLWPEHPFTLLSWHKRILLPVLANLVYPWDRHVSFLIIGVGAASLSAVFFYKIAQKYTRHPLWLAAIYSLLPWLFFSAHLSLNEPLLMLFLLAGYYYYTEDRPWAYTACFALALLSKEVAAIPLLAMTVLIWQRYGWKRGALRSRCAAFWALLPGLWAALEGLPVVRPYRAGKCPFHEDRPVLDDIDPTDRYQIFSQPCGSLRLRPVQPAIEPGPAGNNGGGDLPPQAGEFRPDAV